jgi:hypothetical protein
MSGRPFFPSRVRRALYVYMPLLSIFPLSCRYHLDTEAVRSFISFILITHVINLSPSNTIGCS